MLQTCSASLAVLHCQIRLQLNNVFRRCDSLCVLDHAYEDLVTNYRETVENPKTNKNVLFMVGHLNMVCIKFGEDKIG